jgi:hypothetical protein
LDLYQKFLEKYRVERVAIDFMEKREALFTPSLTPPYKGGEIIPPLTKGRLGGV